MTQHREAAKSPCGHPADFGRPTNVFLFIFFRSISDEP
jgi:hypothetical protein